MKTWHDGYFSEFDYTNNYFQILSPSQIRLTQLCSGTQPTHIQTACELGYGQGATLLANAISENIEWWGTDFLPNHTLALQQEVAKAQINNIHFFNQSFSQFCSRDDLPDFDYICLHGIWSWISKENRDIIIDFLERKLKVGGVLYLSYNTYPGWSALAPFRELLNQYIQHIADYNQPTTKQIRDGITFIKSIYEHSEKATKDIILEHISYLEKKADTYLAHEYLNKDWHPFYITEIAEQLKKAKLNFLCSANITQQFKSLFQSEEVNSLIESLSDVILRESISDHITNRQFRRDLWHKGKTQLTPLAAVQEWKKLSFIQNTSSITQSLASNASLNESAHQVFSNIFSDFQPHSYDEILLACQDIIDENLLRTLLGIYTDRNEITLVNSNIQANNRQAIARYNHAKIHEQVPHNTRLISPLTGNFYHISATNNILIRAYLLGKDKTDSITYLLNELAIMKVSLTVEDNSEDFDSAQINKANELYDYFAENLLPQLKALQVIP